jgi:hypothetical protein
MPIPSPQTLKGPDAVKELNRMLLDVKIQRASLLTEVKRLNDLEVMLEGWKQRFSH